ncbi:MAG: pyridoxamine 5'-phosphate oxidase family protein [Pseudomonadota bacterium]
MDSINRNQPEDNHQDLQGADTVRRVQETVKKTQTCFFCTAGGQGPSQGTRPMSVRKVDDAGNLWFLCANDSHTHEEIGRNPTVELFFQGSEHSDFVHLRGTALLSRDKQKIEELWEPILRTWFTEGINDPRIAVVQVTPSSGYYWDNKHGNAVAGIKMMIGAAVGKTLDDSIEGRLS